MFMVFLLPSTGFLMGLIPPESPPAHGLVRPLVSFDELHCSRRARIAASGTKPALGGTYESSRGEARPGRPVRMTGALPILQTWRFAHLILASCQRPGDMVESRRLKL
jgi:hypothetical protein